MFEAFQFGPYILWTHVVFLVLGIWLSAEFFLRLAQSAHFSLQQFKDNRWLYAAAFAVGGRVGAIIMNYRVYLRDPMRVFIVWDGSFSFLAAAIGVAFVLWWLNRRSRATFLQWLDVLLPATTFGLAFDWIGKFFAGLEYGRPTDVPWGITYDAIQVRYAVPVHPVQWYYAIFYLVLTFLLLVVRKHSRRSGAETLAGIVAASTATFLFEYFRGDFSVLVFATFVDFILFALLFMGLGIFALIELQLSQRMQIAYELIMAAVFGGYILLRPWLEFASYELRLSQLLAVLALLATVVYVVVHRRRYPHL